MVLRFGKFVREVPPGLNYHLPYPIETVLTPQALRVNKIDIGFDLRRGSTMRDVPEESLMLTGDENIVDVNFSVLWKVKPGHVGDFLFNVQSPESTVKAVGESVMRAVIGHSNIQAILTGARQSIETAVQEQMQKTLDDYGAGVVVQQVQLQKVDPPTQVIEAFRDVQRASSDLERAQNEAQTYANRVVPEARGRAAKITPGRRGLSRTDRRRSQGPGLALLASLRTIQKGARRDAAADLSRNDGAGARRHRQDHHRYRRPVEPGVVPYLPLTSLPRERSGQQQPSGGNQ